MAFTIKKRINTKLFIDRTAALYIRETWIKAITNGGDQKQVYLALKWHPQIKYKLRRALGA